MTAPTVLIMAGGTGGHIMPGLAVADELRGRGWQVFWLGNPDRMEGRLVPARGIELLACRFHGVRGKGWLARLKLPLSLLAAMMVASRHIARVRPDVVLGMGGYPAVPGGLMAWLRRLPVVIHEQNAVAGSANRLLAKVARRVLTGFPQVLPGAQVVGNPVRADFARLPAPAERYAGRSGALRLLVVGGSLGAQALNTVVPQALADLDPALRPEVVHQSGQDHIDSLRERYQQAGVQAQCVAFIDDMARAIGQADLLICRAGAMTVAEVAAAGVAALFVPLPNAIDDHQSANARYLTEDGAAWLKTQATLTASSLADWLRGLHRDELAQAALRARARAMPMATQHIADVCEKEARLPS